ncbi:MAG: hypothetical protein WB779_09560 [Ignavibacteriaceae bacterium]
MRRKEIILILFLIVLITGFLGYSYIFKIYEVEISVTPKELFADNQSTVTIQAYPINSFGKKIPFRSVSAKFVITEGKELVSIESPDEKDGRITLSAKDKTGIVNVIVTPEKSLIPSLIQIQINPNYALNK